MSYTSPEVYEHISKTTNDPIVERKTCAVSGTEFAVFQSDLDFYNKISPSFDGQKFPIPTPTLCPEERQRRRLMFRNERKLYKRSCDASGETIISIYSPDKSYKVYKQGFWWSDQRDPMDYGRDFDFNRTFTEQFEELMLQVPRWWLINTSTVINSPYTNFTDSSKDVYMCSDVYHCDSIYYSHTIKYLNSSCDNLDLKFSDFCYECSFSKDLYICNYVSFSEKCISSSYLIRCQNVEFCLFCVGLQNKKYHILNEEVSKDMYEKTLEQINKWNINNYLQWYQSLLNKTIQSNRIINSEKIIGNNIYDSSNLSFCFDVDNTKDSKYIFVWYEMKDCMDTSVHNINCFLDYEAISWWKLQKSAFNVLWWWWSNLYYTNECVDSSNLFGCIGLRNKSYCIFNKQYTKEDYEKTVAKIIAHMQSTGERGEFFHPSLSPFGYNETVANEYFPLCREDTLARPWYKRQDKNYDPVIPEWANVIDWKTTIDDPTQDEDILKAIFVCEVSWRPYRIIKQELEFYRKHNLQLPRKHPDIRHEERMKLRPGRTLYLRNCDKTGEEILSVYAPDYPGKVYSEKAYQQEIYS